MGFTADIDTGGTFTDGLFTDGNRIERVKVDTTPHDHTIAWINCLREGASKFGFSLLRDFLEQVEIMRWSSTVASNVIAERKGPKLGLFVTEGFEKSLYSSSKKSPLIGYLIDESNIAGVRVPLDVEKLLARIKQLLETGVRRICISLKNGLQDGEETKIKEVFEEQYPDHYLGNVPLLLGKDILKHFDDMTRTNTALMNSYVHGPMALTMFKAEDELRDRGFRQPLLVGRTDGGVARVSKTKPVDTIESGPIFGIHAGAYWAKVYQIPFVITLDVGGTTSKIGLVEQFRPAITAEPDILDIPLKQSMLDLRSIALGGGSVAKADGKTVRLGPQSMGAYPGPACYDLGGSEATLTDAFLVKGFLDPDYFSGGAKKVNMERAAKMISENVAGPLGMDLEQAAYEISSKATDLVAEELKKLLTRTKQSPAEVALFAFGGNGGIVGCEAAKKVGIKTVYFFSNGSVLSAFGSSVADVSHAYEHSASVAFDKIDSVSEAVEWMVQEAVLDMEGEGFARSSLEADLELVLYGEHDRGKVIRISCPWNIAEEDLKPSISQVLRESDQDKPPAGSVVDVVRLIVRAPIAKVEQPTWSDESADPQEAFKKEREVYRGTEKVRSGIYDWEKLKTGNTVSGHAVIEGTDTSYVVPRGWELRIDRYRNGVVNRRA